MLNVHRAPSFNFSHIGHGFFTREGGISKGLYDSLNCSYSCNDLLSNVEENRRRIAKTLGYDLQHLAAVQCEHGAKVVHITHVHRYPNLPIADATVTNQKHIVLTQDTADCPSVLFADPIEQVIALAHAGWKSAKADIIEATIHQMCELGAKREQIHAVVGPCIAQKSYEVKEDFYQSFIHNESKNGQFFKEIKHSYLFDLRAYVDQKLALAEIEHISHIAIDTYPLENGFFSYRRAYHKQEEDFGGHLACIYLK